MTGTEDDDGPPPPRRWLPTDPGRRRWVIAGATAAVAVVVVVLAVTIGTAGRESVETSPGGPEGEPDPPAVTDTTDATGTTDATDGTEATGGTTATTDELADLSRCVGIATGDPVALPDDFGPLVPGFGGGPAPPGDDDAPCAVSATSTRSPGRHVTLGVGTSPYALADVTELPNGARRGTIEGGFAAEVTRDGATIYVLGYGLTLDEFDGVVASL